MISWSWWLRVYRCKECGCIMKRQEVEESFMNGYHRLICDKCFDEMVGV